LKQRERDVTMRKPKIDLGEVCEMFQRVWDAISGMTERIDQLERSRGTVCGNTVEVAREQQEVVVRYDLEKTGLIKHTEGHEFGGGRYHLLPQSFNQLEWWISKTLAALAMAGMEYDDESGTWEPTERE